MTDKALGEFEALIRRLASERLTDREIAEKIGLGHTTVRDLRVRFEIPCGTAVQRVTDAERAVMVHAARKRAQLPWSAKDAR